MIKIISIAGSANHGKDTFAGGLKYYLEDKGKSVLIIHFADILKFYCKQYFGWDGNKDSDGRKLLQNVGTDIVRSKHPDFWVEEVYRFIDIFNDEFDYFLIPDFRFRNEAEYFIERRMPVLTVRINRINFQSPLSEEQRNHLSEIALDNYVFDYVVNVGEGLDKLQIEVDRFIEYYKL